jgi:putative spermidine/putrescine transport system ATP-binding protein
VDPKAGIVDMRGIRLASTSNLNGKQKGDKVMIAIRPERIGFIAEGQKENVFDGKVENITFLGSVVRIQLRVGETVFNMDTFNRPSLQLPETGETVRVTCSSKAVLVLSE